MSNVGKATSHDIPQADGQTESAAGDGPRLFSVATAETMHVITIDSTKGATTTP